MKRIANVGMVAVIFLTVMGIQAAAQSQDQSSGSSLGDYARHVRKTPANASKPKVFDNDNLPTKDNLSIIGPAPAASEENSSDAKPADAGSSTAASDAKPSTEVKPPSPDGKADESAGKGEAKSSADGKPAEPSAAKTAEQNDTDKQTAWKQWGDKLNAQKEQVDLLARELDVLQREYQIRAAAMYADAGNRLRNQTDWDKQDSQYKQQIADKQKALDEAKQKLEDFGEEARKAGVPASVREP